MGLGTVGLGSGLGLGLGKSSTRPAPADHAHIFACAALVGDQQVSAPATMTAAHTGRHPHQIDNNLRGYLHEEEALAFYSFIRLDLSKDGIKRYSDQALLRGGGP